MDGDATVQLDVTRLFVRGARFSPTGVDRVVVAYAAWLLSRQDVRLEPVLTFGGRLWSLPRGLLSEMVSGAELFANQQARLGDPNFARLEAALVEPRDLGPALRAAPLRTQVLRRAGWYGDIARRALAHLRPARPRMGVVYVNVSHTGLGDPDVLRRIAGAGAKPLVMVHDLIPIRYPEYCAPRAELRHHRRMRQIVAYADQIVTNSRATADDCLAYARDHGAQIPPVTTAPLGIQPEFLTRQTPIASSRPYFVCVGTIEARKNLAFLLALWRRLDDRMGEACPRLVVVGRRGWEAESVIDHIERSKSVVRLVHEVCDLRDGDLARLVSGAAALLAPSMAEGFDLPVIEALSLGVPVIASRIPVHEELASSAKLLDPLDGPAWLGAIEQMTKSPIRGPNFAAPTWKSHFSQIAHLLGLAGTESLRA